MTTSTCAPRNIYGHLAANDAAVERAVVGFSTSLREEAEPGRESECGLPQSVRTNFADGTAYVNVNKEEYLKRLP
jgi:hypothetical protein